MAVKRSKLVRTRTSPQLDLAFAALRKFADKPEPAPVGPPGIMPEGSADRKQIPITTGVLDYFPAALIAVAQVSKVGNDQHNPGEPLHDARGKSNDDADCMVRHLLQRGTIDIDGQPHSAKTAWRALRILQKELEAAGAPLARGARLPEGTENL